MTIKKLNIQATVSETGRIFYHATELDYTTSSENCWHLGIMTVALPVALLECADNYSVLSVQIRELENKLAELKERKEMGE